ncbi:FAD-binding molybdopterin dehydrogenase [Shinella kummerowiae]|jgi:carbon-monoxide dehydrogenase medium subunit|uniref:FAD-binding molybdopterin dehydrogenase n=1 Tax=Shinella kummerowiae TaxID=417745 RepID=A0A6N8SJR7_9HYPH|nr:FAD binding domain-containing protein [Shinella kummerowiae]MXN49031.1 FAD-binding molybdopterin dehydrogenase [Shinella kummerowiae]
MHPPAKRSLHIARSVTEALEARARLGDNAEFFAGGTWIMRADRREEFEDRHYISIGGIEALAGILISKDDVVIGASTSHAELAAALTEVAGFRALQVAAEKSANPAIRNLATVGGNICTGGFAAADLVPALLCLSASLEFSGADGLERVPLETFLKTRSAVLPGRILTRMIVPRRPRRSAHARLPLKKAGDYPVAIVSASFALGENGAVEDAVIAVGSVEHSARRWTALETAIRGLRPTSADVVALAKETAGEFQGRDGVEAPGWYRVKVLPELARRAFEDLAERKV